MVVMHLLKVFCIIGEGLSIYRLHIYLKLSMNTKSEDQRNGQKSNVLRSISSR